MRACVGFKAEKNMIPVATKTPPGSRPHTFGRSSNVWQYLDLVHDRQTPPDGPTLSAFSESTDGEESEDDELQASNASGEQAREGAHATHDAKAVGPRGSKASIADGEGIKRHSRTHKSLSALPPSLPELHHLGRLREQHGSRKTLAISSPSLVNAGLRVMGGSSFNSAEIMKRLHALGTSSSTPLLAPVSPANNGHESATSGLNPGQNALPMGQASGLTLATASPMALATPGAVGAAANTTTSALGAAGNVVPVSDAEKLRNAFNSQATRLSYGCSVALELFNGHLMMVGSPDGQVRVQSLEKLQTPQIKGFKDRAIFTLLDLADVRSAGSIRYGDSVWLQLSVGPGEVSWEQGGVLGAKVREAPQLKALGLLDDDAIRNDVQAPAAVGYPIPVTAYLPKSRDDGDMQVDEIQSRLRNKSARMLGKWIIRSAVCQRRKQKDNFVYNTDEVYLEQDWFYLGADSDAGVAVLRQLPPVVAGKDIKPGEYVVERRGAWKLRLLDSSSGSAGLSLAQQQMERLLLRAKVQLKQSQRMRAGQTKVYGPNLRGGTGFTAQLRAHVAASTRQTESRYVDRQEWRLKRIDRHMSDKARSMNVALGLECPEQAEQRKSSLRRASSVDTVGSSRNRSSVSLPSSDKNEAESSDVKAASSRSTSSLPTASSCALCHSSSIGYNLCCQFRQVVQLLEQERLTGGVGNENEGIQRSSSTPQSSGEAAVTRRTARSRAGRSARPDESMETTRYGGAEATPEARSATPLTAHNASPNVLPLSDRILQLFVKEDAAMVGLIKYKEKEEDRALYAETQARAALSPVAAHFRDRFKHVGLFMQMHRQQQQAQQDGISGHYNKLHADLYSGGKSRAVESVEDDSDDDEDDYEDSQGSVEEQHEQPLAVDPLEARNESEESILLDVERRFPSAQELAQLTPIDTKAALVLYVQNRTAMAEMLDGYADLADTQMITTLQASLSTRDRGALVETLDFVARASEFVCARRVQVGVAKLLHAVAASDVGDFTTFQTEFDELVTEMQGAVNFIRFFLQTRASRRKDKDKK